MKKLIYEYLSSLLFSILGFFMLTLLYKLLEALNFKLSWGGDKGEIFWGSFIGLPVGSILGILLIDKIYFKIDTWNILGIVIAFIFGIIGNLAGFYLLDKIGGGFLIGFPFFIVLVCICGYKIGLLFGTH